MTITIAAESFARKATLGGGFRCRAVWREAGVKTIWESPVLESQAEGLRQLYDAVMKRANGAPVTVAHFRSNPFRKTYTIHA